MPSKTFPPIRQYTRHFKEVKEIIHDNILIEIPYGQEHTILALIGWESEQHPHIHTYLVIPHNLSRKKLLKLALKNEFPEQVCDSDKILRLIEQSTPYKEIDKKIKALCKESDAWDKKYENFDWFDDVLEKIDSIRRSSQ